MGSTRLGWKFLVVIALLTAILTFSYTTTAANGAPRSRKYTVTFDQDGLDDSATGTVVTINGVKREYTDIKNKITISVESGKEVKYSYEAVVSSSVSGKRFALDSVSGPASPIQVNKDTAVTGNYVTQYYLTVTSPYGDPSGQGWYDAGSIAHATLATGSVSAGSGSKHLFTGWSGDASGTGLESNAIVMTSPKTATANWKTQHYIKVTSAHGNPTPSTWVDEGKSFTASVTSPIPAEDDDDDKDKMWVCIGFSVDGGPRQKGTSYTFTDVQESHSIVFSWEISYRRAWIQVSSVHGSPTSSQWVYVGDDLTVRVTSPADDDGKGTRYRCVGYRIDEGSLQAGASYTFTNVQTDHTIEFLWTMQYQITFTQSGLEEAENISLTVNGTPHSGTPIFPYSEWWDKDAVVTFSITDLVKSQTPGKRYALANWTNEAGCVITSPQTIIAPNTFTADYKTQYELLVTTSPYGTSVISGSGWYDNNTMATTGAAPATVTSGGIVYTFSAWEKDGVTVSGNPVSILMDAPHTVAAYYTSPTPLNTGSLEIHVKDANDTPISGATVKSTSQPSGQSQLSGTTNTNGYIIFSNVIAGSYSVEISESGYATSTKSVTVTQDQPTTETMILQTYEAGDVLGLARTHALWTYAAGLVVLWVGTITALGFVLRANAKGKKEEAGQKSAR